MVFSLLRPRRTVACTVRVLGRKFSARQWFVGSSDRVVPHECSSAITKTCGKYVTLCFVSVTPHVKYSHVWFGFVRPIVVVFGYEPRSIVHFVLSR